MRMRSLESTDMRSPTELARAEDVTGAVARAIGGDARLRYRSNLLGRGPRRSPSSAPHTQPQVERQTLSDLRGSADAIALRARHSEPEIYARHLPDSELERLIYEILEQFRVEALAPSAAWGVKANLTRRFAAWSQDFLAEDLLETALGLLIFSTLHVCRSRILLEPIDERINDLTESTRFGLYEVIGPNLVLLRPAIGDQETYAIAAAALARDISDLVPESESTHETRTTASAVLAMISNDDADDDSSVATKASRQGLSAVGAYHVYTHEFDRVIDIAKDVPLSAQQDGRAALDADAARIRPLAALLRRGVRELFPSPAREVWDSEQEEGYLDPRLLTRLVVGNNADRPYRRTNHEVTPEAAVTILLDCSGSMKPVMQDVAPFVDLLMRVLDEADVVTEVLGYSTHAWSGGRPYRRWLAEGRPANPGRLNESAHLVFKSAGTSWRRARRPLGAMLWPPMFREGIDGEAMAWAAGRLRDISSPHRHLLLICDGSPRESATELANGQGFLDRHLEAVTRDIEEGGGIQVAGLGIGHDLSTYLTRSRIIDPSTILSRSSVNAVLELLGAREQ